MRSAGSRLPEERRGSLIVKDSVYKILIADDGSREGGRAAELGLRLAAGIRAEVILLGIVQPPNIQAPGESLPTEDPAILRTRIEKRFYDYLYRGREFGLEITAEIVDGWPEKEIRKRASVDQVDLVVLGDCKRNWLQEWIAESTARALLRNVDCSVMAVR